MKYNFLLIHRLTDEKIQLLYLVIYQVINQWKNFEGFIYADLQSIKSKDKTSGSDKFVMYFQILHVQPWNTEQPKPLHDVFSHT